MKRFIAYLIIMMLAPISILAQERTVENRPYTDLRPFHFGVLVGTHLQDLELNNVGPQTYINEDGIEMPCQVAVDQDRWDVGFTVGVAAEVRLSSLIQFRLAPTMYFGSRHLTYKNILESQARRRTTRHEDCLHRNHHGFHIRSTKVQQPSSLSFGWRKPHL